MDSDKSTGWQIEGDILTITLDGPAAGTYTVSLKEASVQQHPQAGPMILVGSKDGKPVYVRLTPRPKLAAALGAWTAADRDRYLSTEIRCERCGQHVDGHTAYHQTERSRYGKVIAYYCTGCTSLLQMIGAGEYTAMQERAGERPDLTPETKED